MITTGYNLSFSQSSYPVYEANVSLGIELELNPPPPVPRIDINTFVNSDNASGELLLNYSIINCH